MLGAVDDMILQIFIQQHEFLAEAGYTYRQIAVLFRMQLGIHQRFGADHIDLCFKAAALHKGGQQPLHLFAGLAGEEFGSGKLFLTSEMSKGVNAVLGCSGDYYSYRRRGLTIVDGQVKKFVTGLPDTCYINADGDLILERDQEFADMAEVQAYTDTNSIQFSLSFGPILVKDGENICPKGYNLGEVKERYSRAALCQMDKLHYLYIAAGMEGSATGLMTMRTFAGHVAQTGCRQAYALDGGQTTTIVLNNEVINHVNYGSERKISDIIYFATAISEGA